MAECVLNCISVFSPTQLTTSHVTFRSVVLSWKHTGQDRAETFTIRYMSERKDGNNTIIIYMAGIQEVDGGNYTQKVSPLEPKMSYIFYVTAHDQYGDSDPASVDVTTRGM